MYGIKRQTTAISYLHFLHNRVPGDNCSLKIYSIMTKKTRWLTSFYPFILLFRVVQSIINAQVKINILFWLWEWYFLKGATRRYTARLYYVYTISTLHTMVNIFRMISNSGGATSPGSISAWFILLYLT